MPTGASIGRRLGNALLAGYPLVFASPVFRALFLTMLLAGTAHGMSLAYVSVWATEAFGVGPQSVAMLFVVSGLAGAVGNPLLGMLSDRLSLRRQIIAGQLAVTSLGYFGYTRATEYSTALVLVAVTSLGVMGLTLALVNDAIGAMSEQEKRNAMRIVAAERTAWSMGIILGPALAAAVVTAAGSSRHVFAAAALIQLAVILVILTAPGVGGPQRRSGEKPRSQGAPASGLEPPRVVMAGILAAIVLVTLPTQTRTMYLPLFVTKTLGEAPGMVGPLFTLTAVTAVAAMPYIGAAADRFGAHRVLYVGALVGATYCGIQSVCTTYAQTFADQVLIGFGIALWSTAALIYLQQLMPGRAGAAGGLYVASSQLSPLIAGVLLGPIAENLGIPAAFATTAALCLVSLALFVRTRTAARGPTT